MMGVSYYLMPYRLPRPWCRIRRVSHRQLCLDAILPAFTITRRLTFVISIYFIILMKLERDLAKAYSRLAKCHLARHAPATHRCGHAMSRLIAASSAHKEIGMPLLGQMIVTHAGASICNHGLVFHTTISPALSFIKVVLTSPPPKYAVYPLEMTRLTKSSRQRYLAAAYHASRKLMATPSSSCTDIVYPSLPSAMPGGRIIR